ncbi:MAG: hypothetical protein ABF248_12115 [Yoonia sp.]
MRFLILGALACITACSDYPDLDSRIDDAARNAPFPTLQPMAPLLAKAAAAQDAGRITPASVDAFDNRIDRLRRTSAGLRAPVIDAATLARMRRGVAVPAAIR